MNVRGILAAIGPALLLSPFFAASLHARPLNAKCLLLIDGATYMDDRCYFEIGADSDFFSDLRLVVSCPDGRSADVSPCAGAEQQVTRPGVSGYLLRAPEGVAALCWNEGSLRRATPCFEGLTRDGACWANARAPHRYNPTQISNIKFCAWAL